MHTQFAELPVVDQDRATDRGGSEPVHADARLVASCVCGRVALEATGQAAMFLDVTKGHWVSIYRARLKDAPRVEMRVMTNERPAGSPLAEDVPNYSGYSGKLIWRLFGARLAMGLRTPKLDF
jgi:hypothetical protein